MSPSRQRGPVMNLTSEKLKLILETNRVISSTLNISELLRQVMKLANEVVDAETSSLLLYDEKTGELYFDLALGDKENELKEIRLRPGEGIAGWVAQHRIIQVINDVPSDPRWARQTDSKISFRTRSMIAAPLVYKGALLGVIEAINKKNGVFSEEDAALLEAFAAQAAVSIANARIVESLQEAKEKVEAVFSQMSDSALFVDEKGEKILVNDSAAKLLGDENTSMRTVQEIFRDFEAKPPIAEIISTGDKFTPFNLLRKASKTLYLSGAANRIHNSAGGAIGSIFIFRDVTGDIKESRVKRNFISLISHKLKTPLTTITGYGPLLLNDPTLGEFHRKAVQSITKQGNYLLSLVEKLLHFSIIDEDKLEIDRSQGSFTNVIGSALGSLSGYFDERGAVVCLKDGVRDLPAVSMDSRKIEAAVKNIIENAVKFNNGRDKTVEIGPLRSGGFSGIYIKDNGPGIPPEEREKIFQKFYQIEEYFTGQVEGAGLGLALVKRIIDAHGGKITLESALGSGSTFNLLLPEN